MKRALLAAALAGCSGETGTIEVELATAPGSTLLDAVQTLRMTITAPRKVVTADRTSAGFDLAIELPASGTTAALIVDGLDAGGIVIASGASPRFAFGGTSGRVVVYMAAPNSIDIAPTVLEPARSSLAVGTLPYGAIFAGGALGSSSGGAPSDTVQLYNAYDHSLLFGMPLPAPRAGLAIGTGSLGVYLFGGRGETGTPSSMLWRYDPSQAPAGVYFDYGEKPGFGRVDEALVATGDERFLLTGAPAAQLLGLDGSLLVRDDLPALPTTGLTVTANDGTVATYFIGPGGFLRCRGAAGGACETLAVPPRSGAAIIALPGGKVGLVCGGSDALRIDAANGTPESISGVPTMTKTGCAVATTPRHLVVAGGTAASGVDGSIEVYDVTTLEPVVTATLAVPRTGARALALPNDQVLIVGGVDAAGEPIATLELFTPANR